MGTATPALLTKDKHSISFKWGAIWLQALTIAALIAVLYGQVLADMAVRDSTTFGQIVEVVRGA